MRKTRTFATVAVTAVLLATGAATATAAEPTGRDFAQHVRQANDMFGAAHNPGMHQGFSNWQAMHAG